VTGGVDITNIAIGAAGRGLSGQAAETKRERTERGNTTGKAAANTDSNCGKEREREECTRETECRSSHQANHS
jgi:hypothetical protein